MADQVLDALQQLHDHLLGTQPGGAQHDSATCPQCQPPSQEVAAVTAPLYTEAQVAATVQSAVDAAVGTLRTQLDELRAGQEQAQIDERIATAVTAAQAPLSAQVTDLQTQLDAAVLATAAETARADALATTAAEQARSVEVAARRDARLEAVKATRVPFKDDYLAANTQRWAEMDEPAFAACLVEYAAAAPAEDGSGSSLPTTTALTAATTDSGRSGGAGGAYAGGRKTNSSNLRALGEAQRSGVDIRSI